MADKPKCAIKGCENEALILFAGHWICGVCMAKYDKNLKEQQFNKLQEIIEND